MKERVKELATEVGISVEYLTNTKQWTLIEALAELIVQECADWINNHVGMVDADARADLLKHFGIEQ